MIIADTGALLALFNRGDHAHTKVVTFLDANDKPEPFRRSLSRNSIIWSRRGSESKLSWSYFVSWLAELMTYRLWMPKI